MFVVFCILVLIVWGVLAYRSRKNEPKIKRRDLRPLRRDIEAWQRGERPKLQGEDA
jgi:hypothetical protein